MTSTAREPITTVCFGDYPIGIPADEDKDSVRSLENFARLVTQKYKDLFDEGDNWVQEHVDAYNDPSWKPPTYSIRIKTDPSELVNDVKRYWEALRLQSMNMSHSASWRAVLDTAAVATDNVRSQMAPQAENSHLRMQTFDSNVAANRAGIESRSRGTLGPLGWFRR